MEEEWEKGEEDDGFIAINAGVNSMIRIFNDITEHLMINNKLNPKTIKINEFMESVTYYLDPLIHYFKGIDEEEKIELKKSYGIAGRTKYWRILQNKIRQSRPEFTPNGLDEYLSKEAKTFNEKSFRIIRDLETYFKKDFRERLESNHGKNWFKVGVPPKVYEEAGRLALMKNREIENEDDEKEPWDCLNIIHYRTIAIYGKNWSEIFDKHYTKPGEEKISGGKDGKTKWMVKLERIRNQNFHSYSVTEEEFYFLSELKDWLLEKSIQNDYDQ